MIRDIVKSLFIIGIVSTIIAFVLNSLGAHFWYSLAFGVTIQFAVWKLYTYWLDKKIEIQSKAIDADIIKDIAKQTATLPCAYCGQDNEVPIRLDENNSFTCMGCEEESVVYVSIETVQRTVPVNLSEPRLKINEQR